MFHRQRKEVEMPLDAAPTKKRNNLSLDLKITLTCGNTSSRDDKTSCDRRHKKMLRKLHAHTSRDILHIEFVAVRKKSCKDVLVKRMTPSHSPLRKRINIFLHL